MTTPTTKYVSEEAAGETLRRLFAGSPDSDSISVEEIFSNTGRSHLGDEQNRNWLANKLTPLRHYKMVSSVFSYNGKRKLEKLQLTLEGKQAINRVPANNQLLLGDSAPRQELPLSAETKHTGELNLENAIQFLEQWTSQHGGFEFYFGTKRRENR